jgi:hypothetical protein
VRQSGAPATDTLWAEDGGIFLTQAFRDGFQLLAEPYAGYLNLVPRATAEVAASVGVENASLTFALGPAVVLAGLSLYTFKVGATLLRRTWSAVILAGLVVLLPAAAAESLNTATNLQWQLIFPCFLALVDRRRSWGAATSGSAVGALAATSAPVTAVFAPLALWRVFTIKDLRLALPSAVFLGGLAVQTVVVLSTGTDPRLGMTSVALLPGLFGIRVAGSLLVGEWLLPRAWTVLGWGLAFGASAASLILLGDGLSRRGVNRRLVALAAVFSALTFAATVGVRGTSLIAPRGEDVGLAGSRWTIGPILLLALALMVVVETPDPRLPRVVWRGMQILLAALVSVAVALGFRPDTLRSSGPRWSTELVKARGYCGRGADAAVLLPITPGGWTVTVPCERIEAADLE